MKVIQIMPEFGLAGAEIMCENLSVELIKLGINVIVVSLYDYHSAITDRLEQHGVKVIYLKKKKGLDLSMVFKLYQVFKKEKPDVMHTHRYVMQYAIPAGVLAGVKKRIHIVHNIALKENKTYAQKLNYIFYHYFHVVPVALSEEIQKTVQDRYNLPKSKIPIIFNGTDLQKCIIKENYDSGNKIKYLHIGRFSEAKNHMMLLEAFSQVHKRLPEAQLTLIGTGELKEKIIEKVVELKIENHVTIVGLKDNVYPFLNKSDVFVLPSIYEGMPMTLIEAMGTGLPVIATKVGGIPSMIKNNENGLLVKIEVDDLVNAMIKLSDKKIRKMLGENARQTVENLFSSKVMGDRYHKIYF